LEITGRVVTDVEDMVNNLLVERQRRMLATA
jgi:hypothetical protein